MLRSPIFLAALLLVSAMPCAAQPAEADSAVARIADAFTQAIVDHDSLAAAALLDDSARILEGGAIETRDEYLAHHFHADSRFLSGMRRSPVERHVTVAGGTAWVTSSTRLDGLYRERPIDVTSVETLVLRHADSGWTIVSVHWSSASRD